MSFNWKKSLIVVFDIAIAAYLILAVTAFNKPAERASVCSEVKIDIDDEMPDGFLNANEIKQILERQRLYPLAQPMMSVNARDIEEALRKSPFVQQAECYKAQNGHVCISLKQRMPIMHVMATNGDNYYVDTHGSILPETHFASDLVVATGWITKKYAQKTLTQAANEVIRDKFWQSQIVQINVLTDGSIEMVPRVGDHILYLGSPNNIARKLERLRKFYLYGLNQAGWNKYTYISVEFDNQIICKKK
ncbi:MAG: cell division protein FtsQ [Prevotella sp.]|nr:cell division protein FtsQ [Prevotella sp.]MBO7129400.1 cell division protein FtsQ [Prevotella sp.]